MEQNKQAILLIEALLSGQVLCNGEGFRELKFWCEYNCKDRYYYQSGWGSAMGSMGDRIMDILNRPDNWRIEETVQNET
jgi:hypothetical protein